jgi:hypothetical protein
LIFFSHFLAECNSDDVVGIDDEMAPEDAVDGSEGHALFGVRPAVGDAPILHLQGTEIPIATPEVVTNLIEKHHESGNHVVPPAIDHQLSSTGILNPIHAADAELSIQANCTKPQLCPAVPPISDTGINCTAPSSPASVVMGEQSLEGGENMIKTHLTNEEVKLWLAKGQYAPPIKKTHATVDKKRGRSPGSTKKMPDSRVGGYERGMQMLEERAKGILGRTVTRG